MFVYTTGTIISMAFAWMSTNLSQRSSYYSKKLIRNPIALSKIFALISWLPLTFISAVRYNVGTDYLSYIRIYKSQARHYATINEQLFTFFVQLLNKISDFPQCFFIASSIIICGAYYIAIYKYSENAVLSILLFVITQEYFRSMNGIRQYLAMAIMLFSFSSLEKGNWKTALLIICSAYFMHNSALVFLGLLFLCRIRLRPMIMLGCVTIGAFLTIGLGIQSYILPIIQKFTHFIDYFSDTSSFSESNFRSSFFAIYCAYFLLMLYLYYIEKIIFDEKMSLLLNTVFLGLCLSIITVVFPRNVHRLVWYTNSAIILYTPTMLKRIQERNLRFVSKWIILLGFLTICLIMLSWGAQDALPYRTIWNL